MTHEERIESLERLLEQALAISGRTIELVQHLGARIETLERQRVAVTIDDVAKQFARQFES